MDVVGPADDVATAMRLVGSSGLPGLVVATPVEVAGVMAATHIPLIAVQDGGVLLGAVTAGSG